MYFNVELVSLPLELVSLNQTKPSFALIFNFIDINIDTSGEVIPHAYMRNTHDCTFVFFVRIERLHLIRARRHSDNDISAVSEASVLVMLR